MNYWLIKSPFKNRSWQDVIISGRFSLYGIRNNQARKNISEIQISEKTLYYHNKSVIGVMEVISEPYQDPTTDENWLSIDFKPVITLPVPFTHENIKQNEVINKTAIIKQPKLSVVKLIEDEFREFKVEG